MRACAVGRLLTAGLALVAACPAGGEVTADLTLSLRSWDTRSEDAVRVDNIRVVADAELSRSVRAHLDYDRQATIEEELYEAYGEWGSGSSRLRLGRFQVPFGIHNRSELYYVGLVYPPILRYYLGGGYQVGRSEHGILFLHAAGRWQFEGALFAARGGARAFLPSGGEGSARVQYYAGPLILGLSLQRGEGQYPAGSSGGHARFAGLDFRYSRPSLILRGELVTGDVPGGTPRGFYLDALYRPAALHRATLVGRVETARGGGAGELHYRRQTIGLKWELGHGASVALNQVFETPERYSMRHGTTLYIWHTRRL